ncbi:hypothetical protein F2Q68_00020457 [Brassica cretica]|uniref:S-protein homolog n=1 Tax=Brassica cretica TaxID=69181 RepID=A0A8S9G5V6_BRACR|nr:hypothetical protein F2Q68_00020457 [Brassica cretica]
MVFPLLLCEIGWVHGQGGPLDEIWCSGFPSPIEGLGLDYDMSFDWDGDSHRIVYLCFEAISSPHEEWRNTHSLGLAKKWNRCNLRLEDFGVG